MRSSLTICKKHRGNDRAINSNLINNRKEPEGLKRIRPVEAKEKHSACKREQG